MRLLRQFYRDMITFNPSTWLADNIGKAKSSGVEIQSSLSPFDAVATLRGFYTYARTEDCATGKQLLRRPRHSGGGGVSYRRGPFDALLSVSRVGARLDNDFGGPNGEYFNPAYTRLDAAVTFRAAGSSELFLTASNATDDGGRRIRGSFHPRHESGDPLIDRMERNKERGPRMAVARVTEVVSSSKKSWKTALAGFRRASKTLRGITGFEIIKRPHTSRRTRSSSSA